MATKEELMTEAFQRGILPPDKAALYEEAKKRGMVGAPKSDYSSMVGMLQGMENKTINTVAEAATNVPGSSIEYGKNIYNTFRHPVDTATSLYKLSSGVVQLAMPGEQGNEKYVSALTDHYKDRYGTLEKARQTFAKDPVGFMSDVSLVLKGLGSVATGAGKAAQSSLVMESAKNVPGGLATTQSVSSNAASLSSTLNAAGDLADPVLMAGNIVKKSLTSLIPKGTEEKLYMSAIKMPQKVEGKRLSPSDRANIAKAGIEKGILPNEAGYQAILDKIDSVNSSISSTIDDAAKAGEKVKTADIIKTLDDMKAYYRETLNPSGYLKEIDDIETQFLKDWGSEIPIGVAQNIKQHTYQILRKQYGEMKTIAVDGQKALARGIKDEIYTLHPELKALNKTDQELIQLEQIIGRSAGRISNRDLMGMGVPLNTIAGATTDLVAGTGGLATTSALTAAIIDRPIVKARLAILISKARKLQDKSKSFPSIRQGAYQAGEISDVVESTSNYK